MREIKFRAWGDNGSKNQMLHFDIFMSQLDDTMKYRIRVGDFPIMQYTGLKDKNGNEIFEGDIVVAEWQWTDPHVITWPEDLYDMVEYALYEANLKILGNIYENPELLDQQ